MSPCDSSPSRPPRRSFRSLRLRAISCFASNSWLPVTASRLPAAMRPSARLVSTEPLAPASISWFWPSARTDGPSWNAERNLPSRVSTRLSAVTTALSSAARASPTLFCVPPWTLYLGTMKLPSVSKRAPPPSAAVESLSWPKVAASVAAMPPAKLTTRR